MFDPRKLMPLSMEDCSAPIAVITEITEKTPIVMPMLMIHLMNHSYRSAATGSRREADQAGAKPENKPVRIETAILTRTRPSENWIGKEGNAWPMPVHITYATPSPMNPPSRHSEADSIRN